MYLSKNLPLSEAIESTTALRLGIDNKPHVDVIMRLKRIAEEVFQPIRDWMQEPLYVLSGYRSPELNKAIGGSTNSQHCLGEALDLIVKKYSKKFSNADIFYYISENLEFDQLIWEFGDDKEPAWVHVSYTEDRPNRKQILRARRKAGKTYYEKL